MCLMMKYHVHLNIPSATPVVKPLILAGLDLEQPDLVEGTPAHKRGRTG